MILATEDQTIIAVMDAAVDTTAPCFVVGYADVSDEEFIPGAEHGVLDGTTPVTVVGAPSSGYTRQIKSLNFFNDDAVDVTILLSFDDGGIIRNLYELKLTSGANFIYTFSKGWQVPNGGGGGTASDFTDLGDVPPSYTGAAGKMVAVKGDETGLEFVEAPSGGGGLSAPLVTGASPVELVDDGFGQTITIPLSAGVSTTIGTYLGAGPVASLPTTPGVPPGTLAVYYADDTDTTFLWNGTSWSAL